MTAFREWPVLVSTTTFVSRHTPWRDALSARGDNGELSRVKSTAQLPATIQRPIAMSPAVLL
jgi:hypothetical protein